MNRREVLQTMLFTLPGVATLGSTFTRLSQEASLVKPGNPLRIPPIHNGDVLTISPANIEVWPGTTTQVFAINGSYPGPTIRVGRGNHFMVELQNRLNQPTIIHWHGLLVPEAMDGHPKDAVLPGSSYVYSFLILNRAGTYFYHAHPHGKTGEQVYKGVAGFFIVEDPEEAQLGLPAGTFDIPLAIQDRRNADKPQFVYNPNMMEMMDGYLGDIVLVNGTPDAYLDVSPTLYRLRILNASNARVYRLAFSDNRKFYVVGTDGGLLDTPKEVRESFLSPGERLDILVDFSPDPPGQNIYLKSLPFAAGGMGTYRQGVEMNILRFDIVPGNASGGIIPSSLTPIIRYDPAQVARNRTFTLSMQMAMDGMHRINNKVFDLNRIDEVVPMGLLEKWQIVNTGDEFHPIHVHGAHFQVLDRNSNPNLAPVDQGWKDTVLVNSNETVNLLIRFDIYAGLYLLHCHNLEHEDDGMMINVLVEQTTGIETSQIQQGGILHPVSLDPHYNTAWISYEVPEPLPATVELKVHNMQGREIALLVQQWQPPGHYEIPFDVKRIPAGEYIVTLRVNDVWITTLFSIVK